MALEKTLALIKPDAVKANNAGNIIAMIEAEGLNIIAIKKVHLTKIEAETFYEIHSDKPFYGSLTDFISSAPIFAIALEGDNAIVRWRTLMGATNFEEAAEGTVRKRFATSINNNAVHGSDSLESVNLELPQFFSSLELLK
jgi:nucleoside-diphosphate kinase